ncbi:MAG: hypothetical protein JSR77_04255 [Planctomycetes bacterium]|nr:hypothetical protein [Planctomycetota bacterium]
MARLVRMFCPLFAALACGAADGSPKYCYVNGHYYEVVLSGGIVWDAARAQAEARSFGGVTGHLATITSAKEMEAVLATLRGVDLSGLWLGGVQAANAPEPGGGWSWITGEPWAFTNWFGSEPNDARGYFQGLNEDRLITWSGDGRWNDAAGALNTGSVRGLLVEFDVPLAPIVNPANGHGYLRVDADAGINWFDADAAARSMTFGLVSGTLASITSADEQAFIVDHLGARRGLWLGGVQAPGAPEPAGGWIWADSEPWSWTNWYPAEPNDDRQFFQGINEDRLVFWDSAGHWDDLAAANGRPADANGYIVEFATYCPADFNLDGGIDGSDVDVFFASWEAGDPAADVNQDGGVDGADVDVFFAAWEAGGC